MAKIRVLNDLTINKMAAGEVIDNSSSVVKELLENALDAMATEISIEIQEGGRELIRISDNGCGMSHDDALLSLERHATSKIQNVEDIEEILTMGFRGEALPSIASISKMSLLTCLETSSDENLKDGTLILVDGGRLISCTPAPRSKGTTIEIRSLFFNVPVRRKFQKSPSSDTQEIFKIVGLLAMAHPSVHFECVSDKKLLLKTPMAAIQPSFFDQLAHRVECILGKEYASCLIPMHLQKNSYCLQGFIGTGLAHKPNKSGQHLFINQRTVFSPFLASAIREGYGAMLPANRYPLFVLHLQMPGTLLDVNVHPQKKEVRLRNEFQLREIILEAVQSSLRREQNPEIFASLDNLSRADEENIPPFWGSYASLLSPSKKVSDEKWEFRTSLSDIPQAFESSTPPLIEKPFYSFPPSPVNVPSSNSTESLFADAPPTTHVLTTIVNYCILDPFTVEKKLFISELAKKDGFVLLDQRAAYTRIHYEKLLGRSKKTEESQSLLIPLTMQMSSLEAQAIKEYIPFFNQMGFGIREFGENVFLVDSYPAFFKQHQLQNSIMLILEDLMEIQTSRRTQIQKEEKLALSACRASLPTAKQLTLEEAEGLVRQLLSCELPSHCPSGKPICISFSGEEIAKWFHKLNKE